MKRSTILLVEDDPLLRSDTTSLLEDAGIRVVDVQNADDALAFILEKESEVAVVFTDIVMPGHSDGVHLAEIIARHWPAIRVFVTSGRMEPLRGLPRNTNFVPKPWSPRDLLAAMQESLEAA